MTTTIKALLISVLDDESTYVTLKPGYSAFAPEAYEYHTVPTTAELPLDVFAEFLDCQKEGENYALEVYDPAKHDHDQSLLTEGNLYVLIYDPKQRVLIGQYDRVTYVKYPHKPVFLHKRPEHLETYLNARCQVYVKL